MALEAPALLVGVAIIVTRGKPITGPRVFRLGG